MTMFCRFKIADVELLRTCPVTRIFEALVARALGVASEFAFPMTSDMREFVARDHVLSPQGRGFGGVSLGSRDASALDVSYA